MNILILCTGNRCRSQMVQGILQSLDSSLVVCSAGINPAKEVHPLAIKVMDEIGIDISKYYPKSVSLYLQVPWDFVVTVCGGAKENCPAFFGVVGEKLHIGFDDPDAFKGTDEEILPEFRRVRDEIKKKMEEFYLTRVKPCGA